MQTQSPKSQSLSDLLKTQISLSEWFERIGHPDTIAMRQEDNFKRDRMAIIDDIIGLPFDRPTSFSASDLVVQPYFFQHFLKEHGDELCALRLIPIAPELPKLRMRGLTVHSVLSDWFPKQDVDPSMYRADFMPHPSDYLWSTIFVVNSRGIFGEIIQDGHQQLTQGFYTTHHPIFFMYDFNTWRLSEENEDAQNHLKEIIAHLLVRDIEKQQVLIEKLDAQFSHKFLCGYFETVTSTEHGIWFIDYNRILGALYENFNPVCGLAQSGLSGIVGSIGRAKGRVRIVSNPTEVVLESGDVLVCDMTSPEYVPLMRQAVAIVTNRGGMLCHAAIIARELGIPCIVGTARATSILQDGDIVEVNAEKGVIRKI